MVKKSFALTVEGKTYQVDVVRPGVIAVDGHVFNVEMTANGVAVDGNKLVASLSKDFSIVGGVLYDTEWKVE
jgi:hypothetical protein